MIGDSPADLIRMGAVLAALVLVPGAATFLRPSWFRRTVGVGIVSAFALWGVSWFGGTGPGDLGRGGVMLLFGLVCLALLAVWILGAGTGRRMRTRRTRHTVARTT